MTEILERGDIRIHYRCKVRGPDDPEAPADPRRLDDIQRVFLVLHAPPSKFRILVIGRKRLPERGERFWGYIDQVTSRSEDIAAELAPARYQTRTRGTRVRPAARCAGVGSYALVRHDDHVHLAYRLDPGELGDVHQTLRLAPRGSLILAAFAWKLEGGGRDRKRFVAATPALLDRSGLELVVIGTDEEPEQELGISLSLSG